MSEECSSEYWATISLGEVATFEMGQAPPGTASNQTENGTPFVKAGEFGKLWPVVREWTTQPLKFGRKGDVFICVVGATAGKLNLGIDCAIGRSVAAIRPCRDLSHEFLYYQLLQQVSALRAGASGSAQGVISSVDLSKIVIRLPGRAVQVRIVAKLDALLSELDSGVAELNAAQAKLQRYRQSLLKAAVQGDLTADWRASHPATESGADLLQRILAERRARWEDAQRAKAEVQGKPLPKGWQSQYIEPPPPSTDDAPALPAGWAWVSAEQVCGFITKGTTPPKSLPASAAKTVPFLRVTNLTSRGVLDLADAVFVSEDVHRGFLARSVVFPGDVLMNIVGPPLGQVAVVPPQHPEWNVNQAIAIFRPMAGVDGAYLCAYLLSQLAQYWLAAKAKTTAGQTNLTLETCRALPIALPPLTEQARITELLSEQLAAADAQQAAITHALAQANAQRQNILRAAFAGQLVPQDPADEPAAALLARIRAGRGDAKPPARKRAVAPRAAARN